MNILPARLVEAGAEGRLDAVVRGGALPVPAALAGVARRRGLIEVLLGARPDSLRIAPDGTVDATVSLVESFGREHHAACRLPGGQLVTVRIDEGMPRLHTGDSVKIKAVGPLHLFEATNGERVTGA
jgi:ABC-type sugar transport system ATPase subunit